MCVWSTLALPVRYACRTLMTKTLVVFVSLVRLRHFLISVGRGFLLCARGKVHQQLWTMEHLPWLPSLCLLSIACYKCCAWEMLPQIGCHPSMDMILYPSTWSIILVHRMLKRSSDTPIVPVLIQTTDINHRYSWVYLHIFITSN